MIENGWGNRDSNHVVKKRKRKILFDIANCGAAQFARAHDSPQVTLEKRDARVFNRHICSRAHGYTNIRRGQRRRIINSIARHRHHTSFAVQLLDDLALSRRRSFGLYLAYFQLRSDHRTRFLPVTSPYYDPHTFVTQRLDGLGRRAPPRSEEHT